MKYDDWEARLHDYLQSVQRRGFDPATHHCGIFAADAVLAMTGTDHAAKWRGKSMKAGMTAIRKAGFADHVALLASVLEEVPVAFGHIGDVAVIETPEGDALGIVQGAQITVLRPEGLGLVGLLAAKRMFRVE